MKSKDVKWIDDLIDSKLSDINNILVIFLIEYIERNGYDIKKIVVNPTYYGGPYTYVYIFSKDGKEIEQLEKKELILRGRYILDYLKLKEKEQKQKLLYQG